jgi:ribose 5-phosphate isomerase B
MKVSIASDHAGFRLKDRIVTLVLGLGHEVDDLGVFSDVSTDYPDHAASAAAEISAGRSQRAILICGTGVGMSIAANKFDGVRAAAVSESVSARLSREHNDANVLCIGERIVGPEVADDIVRAFMTSEFAGGERHERRVAKLGALEDRTPKD